MRVCLQVALWADHTLLVAYQALAFAMGLAPAGHVWFAQPAFAVFLLLLHVRFFMWDVWCVFAFAPLLRLLGGSSAPCLVLDSSFISVCSVPGTVKC